MRKPSYPSWLETLGIAILVESIYLGYLSCQYNFDGTVFAFRVEQSVVTGNIWELFHPRHIFYEPAGYLFFRLARSLGSGMRSIMWLEIMDTLFGVAALCLFHRLSLRLGLDRIISAGITLCLAFSFGFWFFSVEPEVYVPGVFFLLVGFRALCYFIEKGKRGVAPALILGALAALAMANHIVNGLFLIPLVFGGLLFLKRNDDEKTRSVSLDFFTAFLLVAVCFGIIFLIYYEAGTHSTLARQMGAKKWFLGLADPETPFGYSKSYWAFHPSAIIHWLRGTASTFFASGDHSLREHPALGFLKWISAAFLILLMVSYFIRLRPALKDDIRIHLLLWLWLASYAAFTVIWEPLNFELKVFFLAPFFLLLGLGLKGLEGNWKIIKLAPALLAALLFIINFYSSILPGADEKNNLDLQRAYFIRDNTEPLARIYIAGVSKGYNKGKIYIPYFSQRQALVMDWILKDFNSDEELENLKIPPGSYVLNELLEPGPSLGELSENHNLSAESIRGRIIKHDLENIGLLEPDLGIYLVKSGSRPN